MPARSAAFPHCFKTLLGGRPRHQVSSPTYECVLWAMARTRQHSASSGIILAFSDETAGWANRSPVQASSDEMTASMSKGRALAQASPIVVDGSHGSRISQTFLSVQENARLDGRAIVCQTGETNPGHLGHLGICQVRDATPWTWPQALSRPDQGRRLPRSSPTVDRPLIYMPHAFPLPKLTHFCRVAPPHGCGR